MEIIDKNYAVCTLRRAENTDDQERFTSLLSFLRNQAKTQEIIFPVHPRTKKLLKGREAELTNIRLIEPIGYFAMQKLMSQSKLILTDSGGLQKEAYFHGKPCITLRDETEWVETINSGWNRLWTQDEYITPRSTITEYGNGNAAELTIQQMESYLSNKFRH